MKRSRIADEQITYALRQASGGTAVADVCRQLGISEATCYVWTGVRELRLLRTEKGKPKRLVADVTLDEHLLGETINTKL